MPPGPPNAEAWKRALGWQLFMFVQFAFVLVYGSILGAVVYLCFWGMHWLATITDAKDQWLKFIDQVKGFSFFAVFLAYSVVEVAHLLRVAAGSVKAREGENR